MNHGKNNNKNKHSIFYVFSDHLQSSDELVKNPKAQQKVSKMAAEKLAQQLKDLTRK